MRDFVSPLSGRDFHDLRKSMNSEEMESFVVRKRRRVSGEQEQKVAEEESTDFKLILLISLHPDVDQGVLLEALLASDGSVEDANQLISNQDSADATDTASRKKSRSSVSAGGHQASLASFHVTYDASSRSGKKPLTKRGKTLHLYTPESIEEHTPCSIIHNFLPADEADVLLRELLNETPSFQRQRFKLFDRVVESPHTAW
jgi:hypothetical protein